MRPGDYVMLYGALILVAAVGLFWLASRHPRPRRWLLTRRVVPRAPLAAVDRQHRHLQAGGLLGETACERTKTHFRELLETGRADQIARELHAGLDFAVQVRALTELGTPEAGRILEQQLAHPLTGDAVEQSWYWVDIATALRRLNRLEALPAVLRCAEAAAGSSQGELLAAEAVAFSNFSATLGHPDRRVSRSALGALVAVARAARQGALDLGSLIRVGLGDTLAEAVARTDRPADPWFTRAALEAERFERRFASWVRFLSPDIRARAASQAARLAATAPARKEWLRGASDRLLARFPHASEDERTAALRCLGELRADVARLFPRPPEPHAVWWADAIRALRWSGSSVVGPVLADQAVGLVRKTRDSGRAAVVLAALKGHAGYEAEMVLVRCAGSATPAVRFAAVGSLGWWPPFAPDSVMRVLRTARTDPDTETRTAAVSALARLGERAALAEVAAGLRSEEPAIRSHTAARIAAEELTWLWPDLEDAAEASDPDAALAAVEALEHLRERLIGLAS
ncbi:MAG TPA: HEAT repeat domain-containing protein [Gemmata sp.]